MLIYKKLMKFAFISTLVLIFKMLIVFFLNLFFPIPFYINYFITHTIILVASYVFHSKITFKYECSFVTFIDYSKAVIMFKLLDYTLSLGNTYLLGNIYVSIAISTIIIFLLRFLVLNKFVFNNKNQKFKTM